MATAYKCDRCGCFFEEKPVNRSGLVIYKNCSSRDICQDCHDKFLSFWFEPVNAKKEKKDNEN